MAGISAGRYADLALASQETRPAKPAISVVIPVHGDQPFLDDQLRSLAAQTYPAWWEIVVADNGCSAQTLEILARWRERLPQLRVVPAGQRAGANYARNAGVGAASGELIAICDSDDVAEPAWLEALGAAAEHAELVGGHLDVSRLNPPAVQAWRPSPTVDGLPLGLDFLPYVAGSNCAIWREVYLAIGGCDEELIGGAGGDDVDLSWRVQLAGGRIGFAPGAVVHYRLRSDLASLRRQMFGYGLSAALLYKKFRIHGARRSPGVIALKHWVRLLQRGPRMLRSHETRGEWLRVVYFHLGCLRGALRHRVVFW